MTLALTWLPDILKREGLRVATVDGWETRGVPGPFGPMRGVICHHTASRNTGNMPSLKLLQTGRSDLTGPLAQLGLGRDGTYYIVAAGRANHAGPGSWQGLTAGNSCFVGIEAENDGVGETWPAAQMDAYAHGVAAILRQIGTGAEMCCGHKEWAPTRKIDPTFAVGMSDFRAKVAGLLSGGGAITPVPAAEPAAAGHATPARATLYRGIARQEGLVRQLQQNLHLETDGLFGVSTEAAVRAFQRSHQVLPDGIVGPKTWVLFGTP